MQKYYLSFKGDTLEKRGSTDCYVPASQYFVPNIKKSVCVLILGLK